VSPTLGALLRDAAARLGEAGIHGAARDARLLLAHAAGLSAARLTAETGTPAAAGVVTHYEAMIARRCARVPLSHITGKRLFYKHEFTVSPDVLDPRPETETLVLTALAAPFRRVLDLGTGSGAILLSLLAERPAASGTGTDVSDFALSVARGNARALGLDARCDWRLSDWFADVTGRFDLIVSNPPYIAEAEMADLAPELAHEPRRALSDGADGLSAYRVICAQAPAHLEPGGRLVVEIGWRQGGAVAAMMRAAGLREVRVLPDLDGRDRVVSGLAEGGIGGLDAADNRDFGGN
jgi:release factor glutamine methyltransferase